MDMQVETIDTSRGGRTVTIRQINAWIASGEPRCEIDLIFTAEVARALLKRNRPGETNRPMNPDAVKGNIDQLPEWENTGEPIIISDEGILNDGQHRLKAIVESGISAVMDLRIGVRRRTFANTNSGRRRSGGDALTIAQIKNSNNVAAMTRMMICYERGLPNALKERVTNGEIVRAAKRWEKDMQAAHQLTSGTGRPYRNAATNALAFIALRTGDEDKVEKFFSVLRYGDGDRVHPAHQLREFLSKVVVTTGNDAAKRARAFAACLLAWNAELAGVRGKVNLTWREGTPYPEVKNLKL